MTPLRMLTPFFVGFVLAWVPLGYIAAGEATAIHEWNKPDLWDDVPRWRIALSNLSRLNPVVYLAGPVATGVAIFALWWAIALAMGISP